MIEEPAQAVIDAAQSDDLQALRRVCDALIAMLAIKPGPIDPGLAKRVLKELRKNRRFEAMRRVAQAFLDDGCQDPQVTRQFAQALIEVGETVPAIGVLNNLVAEPAIPRDEWAEAKGALGRAWKDRAIRSRGVRDDIAAEALRNAFRHYRDVYVDDPAMTYQGINQVALAAWDGGFALDPSEREAALASAADILALIEAIPAEERYSWDYATGGEALVGLSRQEDAILWFRDYASREDTAFALASTVRQLSDIWRVGQYDWGNQLLAPLLGKLCQMAGGSFSVTPADLESLSNVGTAQYEKVLGNTGAQTYTWMQDGFNLARSVVMIHKNGRPHGTGFVVEGSSLNARLGAELLILTNAHVVSKPSHEGSALPNEASITFEILGRSGETERHIVDSIVWQSPPDQHDISLLRLNPKIPDFVKPIRFSPELPALSEPRDQRVYIIGHPSGREISFSFEDNLLLDYEHEIVGKQDDHSPCRIHYRAPTEGGSSGSPVFDLNWRVIGVHHKGGTMPMLNDKIGVYAANEGVWIESVRRAMAAEEIGKSPAEG